MKNPTVLKFKDLDASDEALVIIQHDETSVTVGLSLKINGDIQVVMTKETAKELIETLKKAVE